MPEVKTWIERVRRVDPPDLWHDIELRSHGALHEPAGNKHWLRVAAVFIATVVVIGATLYGLRDLGGGPQAASIGPGEIVRYDLGSPPQPISVGEGAAWVNIGAGTGTTSGLVRIDAATGQQQTLDTPGGDWTAVGGGSAWLLCNSAACGGGSVVRLDPATGEVLDMTRLPARGGQIVGAPAGAWITTEQGVSFVDADGNLTKSFAINQANLVGADEDTLWVSGSEAVRSLDPETGTVLAAVEFHDLCTMEVAAGTVWVASCQGQGDRLMGIDAHSGQVLFDRPIEGYGQMRYADGTLYLAQYDLKSPDQDQMQILAFDPRSGSTLGHPIVIPNDPSAGTQYVNGGLFPPHIFFAVGEDSLWLTDYGAGEVIRVGIPSANTRTLATTTPVDPNSRIGFAGQSCAETGEATTLEAASASAGFQLLAPYDPLADSAGDSLTGVWRCPGGVQVQMSFASGITLLQEANTVTDPARAWQKLAAADPSNTSVGTVQGQPAALIDPAKSIGDALGSVTVVINGTIVWVVGNGQIAIDDLVRVADSLQTA